MSDADCSSCSFNAFVESESGLVKCNLCEEDGGASEPKCIQACPENALSISHDAVGWRIEDFASDYFVPPMKLSGDQEKLFDELFSEYLEQAKDVEEKEGKKERKQEKEKDFVRRKLKDLLKKICERSDLLLSKKDGEELLDAATKNAVGFGVFDYLLQDDELEEISVIGVNKPIYVFHRARGWLATNCFVTNEAFAINAVNKMARGLGRRITFQNPRLNATLPDGSRLHATIAPLTLNGVELTLRKFKQNPFTMLDFIELNTINASAAAFLWLALYADISLLITGNTGSGKTSMLNALFSFIPLADRVVITEETPEINVPHNHKVRVVASEELGIPMRDIVKDTLRMRPDRVIIGEVRSREEVEALLDSLLAGQARGSYATFHANDSHEALARLSALGASREDLQAIDLILVLRRITLYDERTRAQKEIRRVMELSELRDAKPIPLFEYNSRKDSLEKTRFLKSSSLLEKIALNYKSSKKQLLRELSRRERFLETLARKKQKTSFKEFTQAINDYCFSRNSRNF